MDGRKAWIGCLGAALMLAAGCWTTEPSVKPPPRPEEYNLPPDDDTRFDRPIEYPKGTLNQDLIKKKGSTDPNSDPNRIPDRFAPGPGNMATGGGY